MLTGGFGSGFFVGISLALIWTPCVGPILASVIALALSGSVNGSAVLITFAYAFGTAIPLLIVMYGGRALLNRVPWLLRNLGRIQKIFGVLLILVAIALYFNFDRQFQTYILGKFPSYGSGIIQLEENEKVFDALDEIFNQDIDEDNLGKPMFDMGGSKYPLAPELTGTGEWFNSEPLTIESLNGKVVLVDFWTYSCINCIRTLPYIESWHEKYADDGLVIIGVHTPEFEFEKDAGNLQKAIDDFGLTYPIVQDNDYKTWRAYNNRYWPAKYFIDAGGHIRDTHFGEGDYDESEELIHELLNEAGSSVSDTIDNQDYSIDSSTPETYLGYGRTSGFASPEALKPDEEVKYSFPENLDLNSYALSGKWVINEEMSLMDATAKLRFDFQAKDVFLVMNPSNDVGGRVEIFLDGESQGIITVDTDRLYDIVRLDEPGEHLLELHFLDGGIETYAFTFG
ncbi:MAG: cytochrome c biogenesis protein DipZ [bacterium]|nr:cytochrome c biogenesis protein DipZ [bacterium]